MQARSTLTRLDTDAHTYPAALAMTSLAAICDEPPVKSAPPAIDTDSLPVVRPGVKIEGEITEGFW